MATMTKKQMFLHIAEEMAHDAEVVAFCEKEIARLSRPSKKNSEAMIFAEMVLNYMKAEETILEFTNKELASHFEVTPQKMSAAMRRLVGEGSVERIEDGKVVVFVPVRDEE